MEWIATDDIVKETWSRLLEYANSDIAVQAISDIHGAAKPGPIKSNYQKQAQQLRSCLLQAKEYFAAASESSLITSPNHAYYGMVSLASSFMLLRGNGDYSLDVVRRDRANKSHGLDFTTGVSKQSASSALSILQQSHVEVMSSGHFPLWYGVLPDVVKTYGKITTTLRQSQIITLNEVGQQKALKFSSIRGRKSRLLDYLLYLPDLRGELDRFNVSPISSRFNTELNVERDGSKKFTWYIHGAGTPEKLEKILDGFKVSSGYSDSFSVNIDENSDGCIVSYKFTKDKNPPRFSFPNSRVAMSFDSFCYAEDVETHEFVDFYIAAFGLSMLARYFPDLWVTCLDSNCLSSKLIEKFSGIMIKKAPILALSLLAGKDHFISTNRNPWMW